jgi:copper homeostasis protein
MSNHLVLEICTESLDYAMAAERANVHRIELCADLASGGITPSAGLMQAAREHLRVPIHILIRPRPGDFLYRAREFEIMRNDIRIAKRLGMDGVVLGLLNRKFQVDVARTHRVGDVVEEPRLMLEESKTWA